MQLGALISGIFHLGFIVLAIFGLPNRRDTIPPLPAQISEVSIISLDEFEAANSSAPDVPETQNASMAAPTEDAPNIEAPTQQAAPVLRDNSNISAPEPADRSPDMPTMQAPDPDVATVIEAPQVTTEDASLGFDSDLPDAPRSDGSLNSTQMATLAPPTPHLAPKVDSTAAPAPPKPVQEAPEVREEIAPNPEPEPEPKPEPVEEQKEAAPEAATTEIAPDAAPQESPAAPKTATLPRGRPKRVAKTEEPPAEPQEMTREEKIIAAMRATNEAKEAADPEPSALSGASLGKDFTFGEQQAVGAMIGRTWNKVNLVGKENYEQLVVVIRVRLQADGKVMGKVQAVEPANPSGDFRVAFEAARRAVLRAQPLPLPQDKFNDGDYLEIRFDPGSGEPALQ